MAQILQSREIRGWCLSFPFVSSYHVLGTAGILDMLTLSWPFKERLYFLGIASNPYNSWYFHPTYGTTEARERLDNLPVVVQLERGNIGI